MNKDHIPYIYLYLLVLLTGLFSISIIVYGATTTPKIIDYNQLFEKEAFIYTETIRTADGILISEKNFQIYTDGKSEYQKILSSTNENEISTW